MRIGFQATLVEAPQTTISDTGGGQLQLMVRDPVTLQYVSITASRETMRTLLLDAVLELQAFMPVDLSDATGSDDG